MPSFSVNRPFPQRPKKGFREDGMISRRAFMAATTCAGLAALAPLPARAQAYPNNIVRIIVPFPPGGATDVLGRVVAHHLQGLWGQTVVTEYKPGASGLLGARQVITAPRSEERRVGKEGWAT